MLDQPPINIAAMLTLFAIIAFWAIFGPLLVK